METEYKIEVAAHPVERAITLLLNGKFCEDALLALDQSLTRARASQLRVYIDLSEVTLVDRKAVNYFSQKADDGVTIVNCPVYLRRWIQQAQGEVEN